MSPEILARSQSDLQALWQAELDRMAKSFRQYLHAASGVAGFVSYARRPGKLVRPSLFVAGYQLGGGRRLPPIGWRLALSLEVLHVGLLIQDDIMDQSPRRRGGPSLHELFADQHQRNRWQGDADRFGENLALIFGDLCLNWAERIWSQAEQEGVIAPALRQSFDQLKQSVYWGQYLDIFLPAQAAPLVLEDVIVLAREKTARYSVHYPLFLGTALADPQAACQPWLETYALNLGVAYQIIDDILGTFGDPGVTGKANDTDLLDRKPTTLLCLALQTADAPGRQLLERYFQAGDTSTTTIRQIRQLLVRERVELQARQLARRFYTTSLTALEDAHLSARSKQRLRQLAEYMIKRQG